MDKKPHLKPYLYAMVAGFGAIALSIALYFVFYRFDGIKKGASVLAGILMPFIYGGVMAYLLRPFCNWVERLLEQVLPSRFRKTIDGVAVAASVVFGLLVVYALFMLIIPQLISSIMTLSLNFQSQLDLFMSWVTRFFADNDAVYSFLNDAYDTLRDNFTAWLRTSVMPSIRQIVSGVGISVLNVLVVLKNVLIGVIAAVYFLSTRKKFAAQGKLLLYSVFRPDWADLILEELAYIDRTFGGFIIGKIVDSAIIGVLCYMVCVIARFPSALLVSVIIGVTNVIPFFGPFIGAVPATLLILITDPIKALWFVGFIFILQQLDGNVIGPKILGNTTGLSSFWVLFSILLFGGLWGFVGMIVGVPLFAVIYDLIRKFAFRGLHKNGQLDKLQAYHQAFGNPDDPAPTAEEQHLPPPET